MNVKNFCAPSLRLLTLTSATRTRQARDRLTNGAETFWFNDQPATAQDLREVVEALQRANGPSEFSRAFSLQITGLLDEFRNAKHGVKSTMLIEHHWMARWAAHGMPVFNLTADLVSSLLLTEPPEELDPETFRLPFPAFAVTLPEGLVPIHHDGHDASATLLRVHRSVTNTPERRLADVLYVGMDSDSGRRLYRMQPVDQLLREDKVLLDIGIGDDPTRDIDQDNHSLAVGIRLVRNLVAWIEAHGTGSPEPKPRTGYTRRQREATTVVPTTWVLGREVKLGPELRQMATEIASGERQEGWKLRMRYCVRGHWRWQPCGEGRRERRRIFIEPYWKGPEGAAAWQHVFTEAGK